MKYLVRSLKYFVYLIIVLTLVILILVKFHIVEGNLETMFRNGYDSLWQIALIALVFSALYPRLSYSKRMLAAPGDPAELKGGIIESMDNRGWKLSEEQPDGTMKFVKRSPMARALAMWEDTLTFTPELGGYSVEGLTKQSVRVISALEARFNPTEE